MTMVYATTFSFVLLLLVLYVPFLQPIFSTFALGFTEWKIVLAYAFIPLVAGELYKVIFGKK